jgi:type IV pilus assembly protein PilX
MALVASLLLLAVMTILAVGMFRSYGIQDKIAGNTREKQRSLHAAESAQAYAEWWLTTSSGVNTLSTPITCNAAQTTIQICSANLTDPTNLTAWGSAGYRITPPGMTTGTGGADTYYKLPAFNISFRYADRFDNQSKTQTTFYQVDALGYGGTDAAASVVEGLYEVNLTYGSSVVSGRRGRFVDLGGP